MAIITISSNAYSRGQQIALKVAQKLDYQRLYNEIIDEAAELFGVRRGKLYRAVYEAPSFFEQFFSEKRKYIIYVTAAALARFKNDNLVYHGSAGQFFLRHVSPETTRFRAYLRMSHVKYDGFAEKYYARNIQHLLKIRVEADFEARVNDLMKKKKVTQKRAEKILMQSDKAGSHWSRYFFGVDDDDESLYDVILPPHHVSVDDAADHICQTVSSPEFKTSTESQQIMEDLALATAIKAALFGAYPGCEVIAEKRSVEVYVRFSLHSDTMTLEKITKKVMKIPGVDSVHVILIPSAVFT